MAVKYAFFFAKSIDEMIGFFMRMMDEKMFFQRNNWIIREKYVSLPCQIKLKYIH